MIVKTKKMRRMNKKSADDWQLDLEEHDHNEKKAVLLISEDFHLTFHGWVTFPTYFSTSPSYFFTSP